MNMAIRGIDFTAKRRSASNQRNATPQSVSGAKDHFGNTPANSFTSDQHPDYVMATAKRGSATHKRSLTAEPAE